MACAGNLLAGIAAKMMLLLSIGQAYCSMDLAAREGQIDFQNNFCELGSETWGVI